MSICDTLCKIEIGWYSLTNNLFSRSLHTKHSL